MSAAVELVLGVLLAGASLYFVLRPILHPASAPFATLEEDEPEDVTPRAVALRALKEIEFDRATGKLSDSDYNHLKERYTAEALAALRQPELALAVHAAGSGPVVATRSSPAARRCPTHGPRPEGDAVFCSECGTRLELGGGFCTRCGSRLEPEAEFCSVCGGRVAA